MEADLEAEGDSAVGGSGGRPLDAPRHLIGVEADRAGREDGRNCAASAVVLLGEGLPPLALVAIDPGRGEVPGDGEPGDRAGDKRKLLLQLRRRGVPSNDAGEEGAGCRVSFGMRAVCCLVATAPGTAAPTAPLPPPTYS